MGNVYVSVYLENLDCIKVEVGCDDYEDIKVYY